MKVLISEITIGERQRSKITDLDDLKVSLTKVGQINPIIIDQDKTLVAGERRLRAAKELGWEYIEARFMSDLTTKEQFLVELDENIRRVDLSWQDRAAAVLKYHSVLAGTIEDTANAIGLNYDTVLQYVQAGRALEEGDKHVVAATSVKAAANIIGRKVDRAISDELDQIIQPEIPTEVKEEEILNADFIDWAKTYTGRRFNLLHCDFPYGIGHDKSDQGHSAEWGEYADSKETYWKLCNGLVNNIERILLPSSHIIFWFSLTYYQDTINFFRDAGFDVQPFPLIWHKTDNKGILPDPERGPRRVYETALLISLGDRKIIKAVSNLYGCPTSKSVHLSEKPEPMLKHFFQMLVDPYTEILDPTCGSANALIAAERMGAKRILGLEINQEFCTNARRNLKEARIKDKLSGLV